jgi:hypothetical protein
LDRDELNAFFAGFYLPVIADEYGIPDGPHNVNAAYDQLKILNPEKAQLFYNDFVSA